jgi:hypothetical protein
VGKDGLGGLANRWLRAKVKELTTADRRTRVAAGDAADESARQLRNDAIGEAVLGAVPGLRRWRDQQEHHALVAAAEEERRRDAELAARPVVSARVRVTGTLHGTWEGSLAAAVAVVAPIGDGADASDPYGDRPKLVVDLAPRPGDEAMIAGWPLHGWRFEVPGFAGPGDYDLAATGLARRDAGFEPEYLDWCFALGEEGFFFQPDAGPTTVTVGTLEGELAVSMSVVGSAGELHVEAQFDRAAALVAG